MDIAYIGYSKVLLEQLLKNDLYNVKKVVYVPHRVNERYRNILTESKVDCFEINNKNQMDALFEFLDGITIIIMYKFEFIIPQNILTQNEFLISMVVIYVLIVVLMLWFVLY